MPNDYELSEELRYRILRIVDENPSISQRELANALGISVGKVNYCLRALVERGWVKIRRFTNSRRKAAYFYKLTLSGAREKINVAYRFLRQKKAEYEALEREIQTLDLPASDAGNSGKLKVRAGS